MEDTEGLREWVSIGLILFGIGIIEETLWTQIEPVDTISQGIRVIVFGNDGSILKMKKNNKILGTERCDLENKFDRYPFVRWKEHMYPYQVRSIIRGNAMQNPVVLLI